MKRSRIIRAHRRRGYSGPTESRPDRPGTGAGEGVVAAVDYVSAIVPPLVMAVAFTLLVRTIIKHQGGAMRSREDAVADHALLVSFVGGGLMIIAALMSAPDLGDDLATGGMAWIIESQLDTWLGKGSFRAGVRISMLCRQASGRASM